MIPYTRQADRIVEGQGVQVSVFESRNETNRDAATVHSFGAEWKKFATFPAGELDLIGREYFDIVPLEEWREYSVLDAGCGSGRWARFLSQHVAFVEAVDPSDAAFSAAAVHHDLQNVRFTCAGIEELPFADGSFDAVVCLGVLHHLPDPVGGLSNLVRKLRPGGTMVLYVYYALDDAGRLRRTLFKGVDGVRRFVSALPGPLKRLVSDLLAFAVYLPLVTAARAASRVHPGLGARMPLSYYRNKSLRVMRNDALDRFGTPLERRFLRQEVKQMLTEAGLRDVVFSEAPPYWHCVARKPSGS